MNKEAIKILIGIKMNNFDLLSGLEKVGVDLTTLTDRLTVDRENNDITDVIGLLVGMDGNTVYEILEYCHRNYVEDYDKIIDILVDNKDKVSEIRFIKA